MESNAYLQQVTTNYNEGFQYHDPFDASREVKQNSKTEDCRCISESNPNNSEDCADKLKNTSEYDENYLRDSSPAKLENQSKKTMNEDDTVTPLVRFDLDKILSKYGDNPAILQLVLSSKVEEDRRRVEEARLKQKELEYLLSHKVEHKCSHSQCLRENKTQLYHKRLDKGKEKDNTPSNEPENNHLPSTTAKISGERRSDSLKRKHRNEHEEEQSTLPNSASQYSNNDDYLSPSLSSSYISPPAYEVSETHMRKQDIHQQHILLSPSTIDARRRRSLTLNEDVSPRLQPLNYKDSRQSFQDPLLQLPYRRSSSTIKYDLNNSIPPNTLPPISSSLLSSDQIRVGTQDFPLITRYKKPSHLTSAPMTYSQSSRIHALPTLDSFEASIMETLPFDNASENVSLIEEKIEINSRAITGTFFTEKSAERDPSYSSPKKKISSKAVSGEQKSFVNKTTDFSTTLLHNDSTDSEKLPLPPNPMTSAQILPHSPSRPRRRRREMQPITMIIETRDFPHSDNYVWKNNGNTIHKSSGQKSIYYKCSNSNSGCPVNKTVTFRDNGEYLIKYRGSHLDECSKIRRVNLPS